jgi:hypothetical protein
MLTRQKQRIKEIERQKIKFNKTDDTDYRIEDK